MTSEIERRRAASTGQRNVQASTFDTKGIFRRKMRPVVPRSRDMRWVSLHHHSTLSSLDAYGLPEQHVERAVELRMQAMALTEHGNMASHVKLEKAAKEYGIKPIFGMEAYMAPPESQRKNHLTLLAENQQGYRNLLRLNTLAHGEDHFYYHPTLDGHLLRDHGRGIFVLSGCLGSQLATSLIGGKLVAPENAGYVRGREVARRFKQVFGDHYFLEVQAFPELEQTCKVNPMLARIGEELGIPLVATMDVHYPRPEDREIQPILHNLRPGEKQTLEQQIAGWGYKVPLCAPANDATIIRRLVGTGLTRQQALEAWSNAEEIAQQCTVKLPTLPAMEYPLPRGVDSAVELWRQWLKEGWHYRGLEALPPQERERYHKRLRREQRIIEEKGYVDYFLVVADAVRFAKDAGIPVGPARGSAAASLACWLLRITEVDPLRFPNLVFERFIDVSREDMPDVDLDFAASRRGELYEYLVGKYGAGHVGNIGTFTVYKSKLALDDVARVFRVPKWEVETVKDLLIERSSGDLRASATIEDTVEQFDKARDVFERYPSLRYSIALEGNIKGTGVHAAGLVVARGPLTDVASLIRKKVKEEWREVLSVDKYDAEYLGLEKMDFLGLNNMDVIDTCLKWTGMSLQDLYQLPLDDSKVIAGFTRNDTVGIFQFDGRAMRSVCSALKPDNFVEICDCNALARPGPLHSGATGDYIDAKHGLKPAVRLHPLLDDITESTHYQIVYQEQILRICREIGQFGWEHASHIRKIISKKLGEQEFNRQRDRFVAGAKKVGVAAVLANAVWSSCITAGSYAFNAAHCVSYGMLGYWTMFFKVYYPTIFFAAALRHLNEEKGLALLRDANDHEIDIMPPHPTRSQAQWEPEGELSVRAGLVQIKGVGEKTAAAILEWRPLEESPVVGSAANLWSGFQAVKGIGPKTVETMQAFAAAGDPFNIRRMERRINAAREEIATLSQLPSPTHSSVDVPYEKGRDVEVVWLGTVARRNLRELFEYHRSKKGVELDPAEVRDPHLNEWVTMIGEDETESVSLTINRWRYPQLKETIWGIDIDNDVILVRGVKPGYRSARAITINQLWVIDPEVE